MMIERFNKILSAPLIGALYRALTNITEDLHLHLVLGFVGYFAAGYAIHQIRFKNKKKAMICGILLLLFGTVIVFLGLRASGSTEMALTYLKYYQFGILLQAIGVFVIFQQLGDCGFTHCISKVSPLSLGIYLIHPFILEVLNRFDVSTLSFATEASVFVLAVIVFLCSALITKLLLITKISAKSVKL